MTELRSKMHFFATSALLVAGIGCQSNQTTPEDTTKAPVMEKQTPSAPTAPAAPTRPIENQDQKHYLAQSIYLKALDIFDQHEYDLAYLEFGRALDVDPNYYLAWHKKGLCAYYKQRYDLEIECYRRCLEIQPDFMEALQSLGAAYLTLDQLEHAVPIYRRMLAIEPNHPVALYNISICYHDLQDYPAAIEHLRRFIDAHPQDPSRPKAEELLRKSRQKLEQRELNGTER